MRNLGRLDYFYGEMKNLHKENFPDLREGQFMVNFLSWVSNNKQKDPFFPETEEMLALLREFVEEMKR